MHYLVYVVFRGEPGGASDVVEKALAPYWQETEVPPYTRKCECTDHVEVQLGDDDVPRFLYESKAPSPNCPNCSGAGEYQTTRNPDGLFDYWELGGRWKGDFGGSVLPAGRLAERLHADEVPFPWGFARLDGTWRQSTATKGEVVARMDQPSDPAWQQWVVDELASGGDALVAIVDIHS